MRIGALEAKNRLDHLLDLVEAGEEIVITRHGKEVARLVHIDRPGGQEAAHAANRRIRERAQASGGTFDWNEWKSFRDDGRP
jgi:prevent-host-death family protein